MFFSAALRTRAEISCRSVCCNCADPRILLKKRAANICGYAIASNDQNSALISFLMPFFFIKLHFQASSVLFFLLLPLRHRIFHLQRAVKVNEIQIDQHSFQQILRLKKFCEDFLG